MSTPLTDQVVQRRGILYMSGMEYLVSGVSA